MNRDLLFKLAYVDMLGAAVCLGIYAKSVFLGFGVLGLGLGFIAALAAATSKE